MFYPNDPARNSHICYCIAFSFAAFWKRPAAYNQKEVPCVFILTVHLIWALKILKHLWSLSWKPKTKHGKASRTEPILPGFSHLDAYIDLSQSLVDPWLKIRWYINREEIHTNSRQLAFTFANTATTFIVRQEIVQGVGFVTIWILSSLQVVIAVVPPCLASKNHGEISKIR